MMESDPAAPEGISTLTTNSAQARFGVAYLKAVCSQAGVGLNETSPDEDVLAVDCSVEFATGAVRVQVKCTGQFSLNGGPAATWPASESWHGKWKKSLVPVYFVVVMVDPDDQRQWLQHHDAGTLQRAAAFWTRVDQLSGGSGIKVQKDQRLTAATLPTWARDFEDGYRGGSGCGA